MRKAWSRMVRQCKKIKYGILLTCNKRANWTKSSKEKHTMLVVGDDWSGKDNSGGKIDRCEQAAPMGKNSNLKSLFSKENRSKDA